MPTEFSYETVFEAPSAKTVLEAYFNDDHLATQDAVAHLHDRKVVESHDDAATRRYVWTVRSTRQMPVFVRPFLDGGQLSYRETMTWRKADDEIDMTIVPQVAKGRVQIAAVYSLKQIGENQVRRIYKGTITANASLLSGKIEQAILAEVEKGMPQMRECTQAWLRKAAAAR